MYQTQKQQPSTVWPAPAKDSERVERRSSLVEAALPPRPATAAPWLRESIEKTAKDVFQHLDSLAETLPGRNAIVAVFKRSGTSLPRAVSDFAKRPCPETVVSEDDMNALEDAEARGLASMDDVFALHYATGAEPRAVLEAIKGGHSGTQLTPVAMASLALELSGKDSGLIQTLHNMTNVPCDDLKELYSAAAQGELLRTGKNPLQGIVRRMIEKMTDHDPLKLKSLTIESISRVLAKDNGKYEQNKAAVKDLYNEAFKRMYNPKAYELMKPIGQRILAGVKPASLFLFDSLIIEHLPLDLKNRIYKSRANPPESRISRTITSILATGIACGGVFVHAMSASDGPPPGGFAGFCFFSALIGTMVGAIDFTIRTVVAAYSENLEIGGNPGLELLYRPCAAAFKGLKNLFAVIVEEEREKKRKQWS